MGRAATELMALLIGHPPSTPAREARRVFCDAFTLLELPGRRGGAGERPSNRRCPELSPSSGLWLARRHPGAPDAHMPGVPYEYTYTTDQLPDRAAGSGRLRFREDISNVKLLLREAKVSVELLEVRATVNCLLFYVCMSKTT